MMRSQSVYTICRGDLLSVNIENPLRLGRNSLPILQESITTVHNRPKSIGGIISQKTIITTNNDDDDNNNK